MLYILEKVACGNLTGIPSKIPKLSSEVFTLVQIAIPVLLVIMGTLDMFKGITANKEDEITKGRKIFVKRLITATLFFFLFAITKFTISLIDNKVSYNNVVDCMDCFINYKSSCGKETLNDDWVCKIGEHSFTFNMSGTIEYVGSGLNVAESKFKPRWYEDCPSGNEYEVEIQPIKSNNSPLGISLVKKVIIKKK